MKEKKTCAKQILCILKNALSWGGSGRIPKDEVRRRLKDHPSLDGEIEALVRRKFIRETTEKFRGHSYYYLEITGLGIEFLEERPQTSQINYILGNIEITHSDKIVYGNIIHGDYNTGDHYTVTMGDHNSHVVIGRNNKQFDVAFGANAEVEYAIDHAKALAETVFSTHETVSDYLQLLDNLQIELGKENIDLDSVANIKHALLQPSGLMGAVTTALFSIKAITDKIQSCE